MMVLDSGFAVGNDQGRISLWSDDGKPLGELDAGVGPIAKLARSGDQLLVLGARGVALVDPMRRAVRDQIATEAPPQDAQLGPGDGELAVVVDGAVVVYGLDSKVRRRAAVTNLEQYPELVKGGTHAWFVAGGHIQVLDTRTMHTRELAGDLQYGPYLCTDRTALVALAPDHQIHVFDGDGAARATFAATNAPIYVTCSANGQRIAAVTTDSIELHDAAGAALGTVGLFDSKEAGIVRLVGDDVWTGSVEGVLRRYHDRILVASLPALAGKIVEMKVSERHVIARGEDATFVAVRETASQLALAPTACAATNLMMVDAAVGAMCGDDLYVYIGRHLVGAIKGAELAHATLDPASQRGAVEARTLSVFDPKGKPLAHTDKHTGLIAFADADHVLVAEQGPKGALWSWAFAGDGWERVMDLENASALAVAGRVAVVGEGKQLLYIERGRVRDRRELRAPVQSLATSPDGHRIAAQLAGGATVILDDTGRVLRELEPSDAAVTEAFDDAGSLIVRPRRGSVSVWDATTGDLLLYELDMFRYAVTARFASDGRLEIAGSEIATVAIAPDRRPVAAIERDIACRVPLRVAGNRLEPRVVTCP
jgi:hypothetical protein